jgi:hypothetical protein
MHFIITKQYLPQSFAKLLYVAVRETSLEQLTLAEFSGE